VRDVAYGADYPIVEPGEIAEIGLLKRHVSPPHLRIADPLWGLTVKMCGHLNSNK
jgi:hypothetical protein